MILKHSSYGLPADRTARDYGRRRWCSGCAKSHPGAVKTNPHHSKGGPRHSPTELGGTVSPPRAPAKARPSKQRKMTVMPGVPGQSKYWMFTIFQDLDNNSFGLRTDDDQSTFDNYDVSDQVWNTT